MRRRRITVIILIMIAAAAAGIIAYLMHAPGWQSIVACMALILLCLFILYRSVVSPLEMVEKGFGLLLSRDFNSRLCHCGEPHADKIADLFNRMATELKGEQMRLREQENFLNQLVAVSPMGVAVMDYDYRITMANGAFMKMIGRDMKDASLKGKKLEEIDSDLVREILEIGQGKSSTVRLNDTHIYRVSNLSFMENGFRRPFILLECLTEEVMKAERSAYGKVIRVISHEVNNTMGGVSSAIEMFGECFENDLGMKSLAESCEERCRSLSDFIGNYADVVKLPEPNKEDCDINGEISGLVPFLNTLADTAAEGHAEMKINLEMHLSESPLRASLDRLMWEQVLINIVKNAAESVALRLAACGEVAGKIEIATGSDADNRVYVEITDNGRGIDRATSQKLFTPFFSTKSNGRGIGLTLINEVLTRHGCRFSLLTGNDGLTRFRIIF